jgi:hypothetical protein
MKSLKWGIFFSDIKGKILKLTTRGSVMKVQLSALGTGTMKNIFQLDFHRVPKADDQRVRKAYVLLYDGEKPVMRIPSR